MANPFGPAPLVSHLNRDPAPIRRRKDYQELAMKLGEAITELMKLSGDQNGRYQAEVEALQEVGVASYKLMKYIEKHAWEK